MSWEFKHAGYYMQIARVIGQERIRCYSRNIGAVLVKDDKIISTGFNGPPRGIPMCDEWQGNWWKIENKFAIGGSIYHDSERDTKQYKEQIKGRCPRHIMGYKSGEGLEYCPAAHAERNCLLTAASLGIATEGSVLYADCCFPCKDCIIELIQAGVRMVSCHKTQMYDTLGPKLIEKSNMQVIGVQRTFVTCPKEHDFNIWTGEWTPYQLYKEKRQKQQQANEALRISILPPIKYYNPTQGDL